MSQPQTAMTESAAGPAYRPDGGKVEIVQRAPIDPPSNTGSVTYTPSPGDPDITVAFGKTFRAGKSVSIEDPKVFAKLRGHPNFSVGDKRLAEKKDADAEELDKEREKATKEAEDARREANEATAEAEAKERAEQALNNLRSAENDPDRKPPVTNVPSKR